MDIKEKVTKGNSFSQCLAGHKNIFSEYYFNMVKVGEEAGNLEDVLNDLAVQMEKENKIKNEIKGALIYPAVIIMCLIVVGIVMFTFVLPKISEFIIDMGVPIPWSTTLIINLSIFLNKKWYLLVLGLIIFIICFLQINKTKKGKQIFERIIFLSPISHMIKLTNLSLCSRNLRALLLAGVSFPRALEITAKTLSTISYQETLFEAAEKIRKGGKTFGNS